MKKVLFATTALIASAGVAAADDGVTTGGYGYAGVLYDSSAANQLYVLHAVRLTFSATVTTDAGAEFSAHSRITITNNNDNGMLGHNRIDMRAGGLYVRVGATHGAAKTLARTATFHGFNDGGGLYIGGGTGIDNNTSALNDSGNNVLMQYTTGAFTVGVATQIGGTESDIAVKYDGGMWTAAAGFATDDTWMASFGYNGGTWSANIGTNNNEDIVAVANFAVGAATSINVGIDKPSGMDPTVGLQVAHDLGGGVSLIGNIGQLSNGTNVGGIGAFFSF